MRTTCVDRQPSFYALGIWPLVMQRKCRSIVITIMISVRLFPEQKKNEKATFPDIIMSIIYLILLAIFYNIK